MQTAPTKAEIDDFDKEELINHLIEKCGFAEDGRVDLKKTRIGDLRIKLSEHYQNNKRFA